jgi:hypothetical protein
MTRTGLTLAIAATLLISGQCYAGSMAMLPPEEFDYPYPGAVFTMVEQNQTDMFKLCKQEGTKFSHLLGCSWKQDYVCHIVLAQTAVIEQMGQTVDTLMRHEHAHCNGWGPDHAGARHTEQQVIANKKWWLEKDKKAEDAWRKLDAEAELWTVKEPPLRTDDVVKTIAED